MKKVITAQDISEARKAGATSLPIASHAIVTPQAQDDARSYGITLQRVAENEAVAKMHQPLVSPAAQPQASAPLLAGAAQLQRFTSITHGMPSAREPMANSAAKIEPVQGMVQGQTEKTSLMDAVRAGVAARLGGLSDAALVNSVIADVMVEMAGGQQMVQREPAGALPAGEPAALCRSGSGSEAVLVRGAGLSEQAGSRHGPGGMVLTDILAPGPDGPGVGMMEFSATAFEMAFAAHEVLTVLEGELVVTVQGQTLRAGKGDAVRLSAGAKATLSSGGYVRCLYSAWPV